MPEQLEVRSRFMQKGHGLFVFKERKASMCVNRRCGSVEMIVKNKELYSFLSAGSSNSRLPEHMTINTSSARAAT